MKSIAFALLLLAFACPTFAAPPNLADYPIDVQVTASQMTKLSADAPFVQQISATVGGKKYRLQSEIGVNALLSLGNYKAKLVTDEHKKTYDSFRVYELLLPDQKTRRYIVIEQLD